MVNEKIQAKRPYLNKAIKALTNSSVFAIAH